MPAVSWLADRLHRFLSGTTMVLHWYTALVIVVLRWCSVPVDYTVYYTDLTNPALQSIDQIRPCNKFDPPPRTRLPHSAAIGLVGNYFGPPAFPKTAAARKYLRFTYPSCLLVGRTKMYQLGLGWGVVPDRYSCNEGGAIKTFVALLPHGCLNGVFSSTGCPRHTRPSPRNTGTVVGFAGAGLSGRPAC